ncbi:MAG TPA: hypothetical protein VLH77_05235, partial [Gammaproteobacteria bacterium]|nr:hypothetical protein [Gammaproteobacteria bacterium]
MGFLNHARIFLNTKVKNQGQFSWWSGSLQSVGNFFLAPTRFLFLGKTVRIYTPEGETEEAFAKVSSFFYNDRGDCGEGPSKISKQQPDQRLESQNWSWLEYTAAPLALVLAIPFGIVGAFCKLISYVDPSIYNAHHKVVSKLTAEDRIIDLNFMDD